MRKTTKLFCVLCLLSIVYCLSSVPCWAVPSGELIAEAKLYDNQEVWYEGELVGSVLNRGDFVWLNLNDGTNALGVWAPRSMIKNVKRGGGYAMRGDWIGVSGIFYRSCLEHGGGLDIHAQKLAVLKEGEALPEIIARKKILLLAILLGVFACLLTIYMFQTKQRAR
jgi:hypothetical protein